MSNQAEESRLLGIDFVSTYYGAMSSGKEEPKEWLSQLSVWTSGEEGVEPATQSHIVGREAISMEVESFSGLQVELSVVDSQFSVNNGLFVLACGTVKLPAPQHPRKFVQSFFLAKEATGYSINNSILRFLRDPEPIMEEVIQQPAETVPEPQPQPVEPAVLESAPPVAEPAASVEPVSRKHKKKHDKKSAEPPVAQNEVVDAAPAQKKPAAQKPASSKPKSFLDAVSRAPSKNSKRVPPKPKPAASGPGPSASAAAPKQQQKQPNGTAAAPVVHHNLDAQCYVSNIPFSATNPLLRKALSKYGPVKNIIRPANKGYGFLEYEKDADADRAIEEAIKNPVMMSGRRLNIERRTGKEDQQPGANRGGAGAKKRNRGNRKGKGKNPN